MFLRHACRSGLPSSLRVTRPQSGSPSQINDPTQGRYPLCSPQLLALLFSPHVPNVMFACPAGCAGACCAAYMRSLPTREGLCRVVTCQCWHQMASGAHLTATGPCFLQGPRKRRWVRWWGRALKRAASVAGIVRWPGTARREGLSSQRSSRPSASRRQAVSCPGACG